MMPNFHIREANLDDAAGIAKVRVATWQATYQGIVPDDFLRGLSYERTAERWRKTFWEDRAPGVAVFVAENQAQEIVGIAICGPEQSQDPIYQGEIYVLYVLPQYQNQGIGRRLVAACVGHLTGRLAFETMLIWVIAENPYRKFYESLGGRMIGEKSKEIGGKLISEVSYGWEEIHKLANSPRPFGF
jgi:ribosomal protein S18 acetylase RimI-like enzyme